MAGPYLGRDRIRRYVPFFSSLSLFSHPPFLCLIFSSLPDHFQNIYSPQFIFLPQTPRSPPLSLHAKYNTAITKTIQNIGRWKVLHHTTLSIYKPIIISPFFAADTRLLEIYITSDLWSPASGTAFFTWYTWSGDPIPANITHTPTSADFVVGGLNTTRLLSLDLSSSFFGDGGGGWDPKNAILFLSLVATGSLPNSGNETTIFKHDNFFHPVPLSEAKLVDPGLVLSSSASSSSSNDDNTTTTTSSSTSAKDQYKFTIKATTGFAVWVWLEYPAAPGLVGRFDDNAFLLRKGEEKEVVFRTVSGGEGGWEDEVTVRSLWDNYVP